MQLSPFPTLDEAVKLCVSKEKATSNEQELGTRPKVSHMKKSTYKQEKDRGHSMVPKDNANKGNRPKKEDMACHSCGKKGHFAAECRSKPNKDRGRSRSKSTHKASGVRVGKVSAPTLCKLDKISIKVQGKHISGHIHNVLPDSGSAAVVFKEGVFFSFLGVATEPQE